MKRFAVVCSSGIGDSLLMQIAARHLRSLGAEVITFSNFLPDLSTWFPGFTFKPALKIEEVEKTLSAFDGVILQHDNSEIAKKIHALHSEKLSIYTLYGTHLLSKHGPLRPGFDVRFDQTICMAENIAYAMQALFPEVEVDLANGLVPLKGLTRNRFPNRIAIHPTSSSVEKNWPKSSFLRLRDELSGMGWDPVFIVSPSEATEWNAPKLPTLSDLATFLYESGYLIGNDSGPGHLASNLGIPTVIIGQCKDHLTFWRPGWLRGELAHPPSWTGKTKLTKNNWKLFISLNRVIKQFKKITDIK